MKWFGSIFDVKESKDEDAPKEGKDGNYTYSKSGTEDKFIKKYNIKT